MERARSELDWKAFDAIAAKMPNQHPTKLKYLEIEKRFQEMWNEATRLDLHLRPRETVLDIGTGAGHFPYVCRYLGHEALALDRPGARFFDELRAWIGVDVIRHTIAPKQPLPSFPTRFETVTAFRIGFNRKDVSGLKGVSDLFDLGDWGYFLDDLRDNVLSPRGRLVMKLNWQPKHRGLHYGDSELMAFFQARGAMFADEGRYLTFDPLL